MNILFLLYGIIIGSFLNVCILRIPLNESITFDRSHCPKCGYVLKWYDLIPLLSYIILRGKCRSCQTKISSQYPIIELLNGAAYLGIYLYLGLSWQTLIACFLFSALLVVFMIDLRYKIIPNGLVLFILLLGVIQTFLTRDYLSHIIGFFIVSGILILLSLMVKNGMGMGDIKLMAAAGLLLGWDQILLALMIGAILGSVIGISLIVIKVIKPREAIPFGPFLATGIMTAMLFGEPIINWYIGLVFR
ncbi:MAG: prepilin peptidase [Firmicutes bacterium HGW-Firmicutes-3]|jgi:leader peptidase (prepilin peptidase)/N-methyltransferase|nr:MAG: prepilin peptidase [Firmicutes bacterium HGW-Firmicutes-3]